MWKWIRDFFCEKHPDEAEINQATPPRVRSASHDLAKAVLVTQKNLDELKNSADALVALVSRIREKDERRNGT